MNKIAVFIWVSLLTITACAPNEHQIEARHRLQQIAATVELERAYLQRTKVKEFEYWNVVCGYDVGLNDAECGIFTLFIPESNPIWNYVVLVQMNKPQHPNPNSAPYYKITVKNLSGRRPFIDFRDENSEVIIESFQDNYSQELKVLPAFRSNDSYPMGDAEFEMAYAGKEIYGLMQRMMNKSPVIVSGQGTIEMSAAGFEEALGDAHARNDIPFKRDELAGGTLFLEHNERFQEDQRIAEEKKKRDEQARVDAAPAGTTPKNETGNTTGGCSDLEIEKRINTIAANHSPMSYPNHSLQQLNAGEMLADKSMQVYRECYRPQFDGIISTLKQNKTVIQNMRRQLYGQ